MAKNGKYRALQRISVKVSIGSIILLAVSFGYDTFSPYLSIWALFGRTEEFYIYCLLISAIAGIALKSLFRILEETPVWRIFDGIVIILCVSLILNVHSEMHQHRRSLRLTPVESQEGEMLYMRRRADMFGNVCAVYYQKTGIIFYEYLYDADL